MKDILIIVSSLGKNVELAKFLLEETLKQGGSVEIINIADLNLPLYTSEVEKKGVPKEAKELSEKFIFAKGFIFVAPEYNGSVPPVFNNTISWISRTGDDWREAFNQKIAAIATHSGGGGSHVLMSMRQQLSYIGVNVLGRTIQTNYSKTYNPDSGKAVVSELLKLI